MSTSQPSARVIDPQVINAICAVVDYHWTAERADYERQDADDRAGHVFEALTTIHTWLQPPADLAHFHETVGTNPGRHRYTLVRFYRRGEHTFRVRMERDSYEQQSYAVAEVLTADRTWSPVVSNAPSNWHDSTSLGGDEGTGVHPEPGFTTLRRLADALAGEAMLIVPA